MSLLQQFYKAQVDADADKKIKAVAGKATANSVGKKSN
jgi:hypothetical protein